MPYLKPKNPFIATLRLLIFFIAMPFSLVAQLYSQLWPNGGNDWDSQNSRLKDFTNVGYMRGAVAIPDWPVGVDVTAYGAIPDDGIDDSQAFIDAIADCPDNRAVFVPKGRYTILQQMIVPDNDYFVLRGEDMYETVLHFPKYLNEIYIQEVGFGNPAYYNGSNGYRHTGGPKGFFRIEDGTHRSIENLTFEFREQMKMGHWEHKGASAISYSDDVVDSWVRNIYVLNGDNAVMMGRSERISVLNIIFDHFIGRPDLIGSSGVHRWVGHIALSMHNTQYNLYHNIDFRGNYFHELDNNNVPKNNVISNFTGTDVALHHHGTGSNNNLYTNASVGRGPGIQDLITSEFTETHWRIYGDDILEAPTDPANLSNGHVFVGYKSTQEESIIANNWYEVIDPAELVPQNIYLAQLQHSSVNKPLPEGPPAPPPSQFIGDVIRINPIEDNVTDVSNPDTPQDFSAKSLSVGDDIYFKFDLNGLSLSSIAKVRLRVSSSKFLNTPVELSVSSIPDTWSEDTLTYNSAPDAISVMDSIQINKDSFAQILEFDVTPFVQAEWAVDKVVSFVIKRSSGSGALSGIRSSEMGIAPELVIEQVASSVPGAPSAPAGVKSYSLIGNVQLDWADNPESDVATYNVYRSTVSQDFARYDVPIGMGLVTSDFVDVQTNHESGWDIGMMRYDTAYYYRVTAVDEHGYESASSIELVGTALGPNDDNLTPPSFNADTVVLPDATQYVPYSTSLVGSASDPEGDPLYFSKVDGPDWLSIAHDGTVSGTPRLGETGTFQFTVQVNALGSGRDETTVEITVNPGPPDAPLGLDAVPGDAEVQLEWSHDSEGSANFTFTVHRATQAGGPYTAIVSGLSESDYTDLYLDNGTTYYYVVTATNSFGESPDSYAAFATPNVGLVVGTNYIGGLLTESASWDNGLPDVGQFGRVNIDATIDTSNTSNTSNPLDSYSILHTGGTLSPSGINGLELTNGSTWITEGVDAATSTSFRGFRIRSGSSFTLYSGTINTVSNRDWGVDDAGSSITVNGGIINLGRHLRVSDASFTINAGIINGNPSSGDLGVNRNGRDGILNFNGGTTAVHRIDLSGANSTFNFGGSSFGSLSVTSIVGFGSNSKINFLPGSRMSLTVSGEDEWAAARWAAGELTYNGQSATELGSWAGVTAEDGLETNVRFEYGSSTETLILASGLPAPASQLNATGGDSLVGLTWLDNSNNETGFQIQRSTSSGNGFSTIHTTSAGETNYSDTGLSAGTTFYYQVIATNAEGESSASDEVSATTWTASESWRNQYFGQTENSGDAADNYDYDGDGAVNMLERAFGTVPTDPSSLAIPASSMVESDSKDYLSITYRRLIGGSGTTGVDYTVDGLTYTVEYDTDLADPWSSGTVVQVGSASDNNDGTETVTLRLSDEVGAETKQFIRIKVSSPQAGGVSIQIE
ncbi:MAG: hypothetical protein ACJAUA_000727 [Zhongshania aliphaticivorans]|jgi:hypothetical protein